MDEIAGLRPTGRQLKDPAATLVELAGEDGSKHNALVFDEIHRGHPALGLNVELVLSFLQYPMVVGLAELEHHDLDQATFGYPTGPVWTLKEILRIHEDLHQAAGLRAGLELALLGAQILTEAGENGPVQGCFSHGNLNPWRIALRPDGQVQVIGHGLAQVELLRHRDDPSFPIEPDSVRYAPPERLEGLPEDTAADTFALTLIAYEVITGRPLHAGHDIDELKRMVALAEGASMLSGTRTGLPKKVAEVFAQALIFDPDTRLTGDDYVGEIEELLAADPEGESLVDVVNRVRGTKRKGIARGRKVQATDATSAFSPEMLKELAEDDDDTDGGSEASSESGGDDEDDSRWTRPSRRRGKAKASEAKPSEAKPSEAKKAPKSSSDDEAPARPKRRLRRRSEAEAQGEAPAPRRRRRRRTEPEAKDEAKDEAATETGSKAEDDAPRPRRRRRRRTSDD